MKIFNVCFILLFIFIGNSSANEDEDIFSFGYLLGFISGQKSEIGSAFTVINMLDGLKGEKVDRLKTLQIKKINHSLMVISRSAEMIEINDSTKKILIETYREMSPTINKNLMIKIDKFRNKNKWFEKNSEYEKIIQDILRTYKTYGCPFKIKI